MKAIVFICLLLVSIQATQFKAITKFFEGFEDESGLDLSSLIGCFDEPTAKIMIPLYTKMIQDGPMITPQKILGSLTEEQKVTFAKFYQCTQEIKDDLIGQIQDLAEEKEIDPVQLQTEMDYNMKDVDNKKMAIKILQQFNKKKYAKAGKMTAKQIFSKFE